MLGNMLLINVYHMQLVIFVILNKLRNIIIIILIFILCFLGNTCRNIFNICDQKNQAAFVLIDNQSNMIIKSGTYKSLKTYFIFKILKQSQEPRIQQNWGTSFDNLFSDTFGRTISVKIILFGGFSKGQSADLVTQQ